jgi:hypothetical protein
MILIGRDEVPRTGIHVRQVWWCRRRHSDRVCHSSRGREVVVEAAWGTRQKQVLRLEMAGQVYIKDARECRSRRRLNGTYSSGCPLCLLAAPIL